jgi:biopolymer transport protein ExbD
VSSPFAAAEEAREIAEVNVVPLADVSLVLLIILLVLSPMMRQAMLHVRTAADSPKREVVPPEELLAPKPTELVLVVGLNPDGLVVGQEHFSDPGAFIGYMQAQLQARVDKKVFLSPHPDVPVGLVVHTLETIKTCGAESVALVQTAETIATADSIHNALQFPSSNGQIPAAAPPR